MKLQSGIGFPVYVKRVPRLEGGQLRKKGGEEQSYVLGPVHILTSGPKAQASEAKAR